MNEGVSDGREKNTRGGKKSVCEGWERRPGGWEGMRI